ncbi:transglycosylase SLT domain-containing protein [Agrobacterium vitis]|nr:lytic transglycosylase domain-containing protein [Allorhizobium ampelinum]MCF1492145.1 lytic transglycosylase domain-containing protein [Allorhizobium ampelinum]MVA45388.1 transglycosylase SLT domain-containing protein [Agrobacterium vitis]
MGAMRIFRTSLPMKRTILLKLALSIGVAALAPAGVSWSQPLLGGGDVPAPANRPAALSASSASSVSGDITGSIPVVTPMPVERSPLKSGLDALSDRNGALALSIRDAMPQGLDRHMLTWSIAMSGLAGIPSSEIANAQRELKGWPGLSAFRANSEKALLRENPPAPDVLAAFGETKPETAEGTIILTRALVASGNRSRAVFILKDLWRSQPLEIATEDRILSEFGGLLTRADHKLRMDYLMYRGRTAQAKRFASLGDAQALYVAWMAVNSRSPKAVALIQAASARFGNDPALLFVKIEYQRRQDNYQEAAKLLALVPRDASRLVNPGEWWNERRIVARGLADDGKYRLAYQVAAGYTATDPVDIVDAEFHAGWYALRGLNDPKTAAQHFRRIVEASNRPLSASRAYYWLGRADEAQGNPTAARQDFVRAADYPGTFYGQLAGARLKQTRLDIRYPTPTEEDRRRFASREAIIAIDRYKAAGHEWRGASLYRALAEQLQSPGELALLASKAERAGNHQLSLQVGKTAYGRGINVPALAFPIGVIPASANIAGSGKALAYAIARQESAFNPAAVSAANAKGLLQLMPATAKAVAKRHDMAFSPDRLTQDAAYNATLGAHYLGEQIDAFGGSYILTFIAYNAGPKRVPEWINRYGDPRGMPIDDVVDWIERIPFPETRGYVQRVMENYQIYKTRLGQTADIEHDLRYGR